MIPALRHYRVGLLPYGPLGAALLGQAVARLRGGAWAAVLAARVLDPLGLAAPRLAPGPPAAPPPARRAC